MSHQKPNFFLVSIVGVRQLGITVIAEGYVHEPGFSDTME
jgi:hypothetical protein